MHSDRCFEHHACAGVYVKQVLKVVCISVHICVHARYKMYICAHVGAVCSFSVRKRGWGGSAS